MLETLMTAVSELLAATQPTIRQVVIADAERRHHTSHCSEWSRHRQGAISTDAMEGNVHARWTTQGRIRRDLRSRHSLAIGQTKPCIKKISPTII